MPQPNRPPLIEARAITKTFGDFTALSDVTLRLAPGERRALLGENGAGKSTFVKILYGALAPSGGEMRRDGAPYAPASPGQARAAGVGMVHQHFAMFDALTVEENVALALPDLSRRALRARLSEMGEAYGLPVDPQRRMFDLSVGEKQRVEVLRALMQDPRLLILDEPTSVLTPQEADALFAALRRISAEGRAILYISHRLEEVRALCESATILRRGEMVWEGDPATESAAALAERMVGASFAPARRGAPPAPGPVRLRLNALDLPAASDFATALRDVSLEARGGEVLGVAGVAGEGQSELCAALIGETLAPQAAMIEIDGVAAGRLGPDGRRALGAAFAPEERNGHAAIGEMSLTENLILTHHAAAGLSRAGVLRRGAARDWTARVRAAFDVRGGADDAPAATLSGGNLQKFVIGREILRQPGLLVVNQPSWGVDAAAAAAIRQALIELARGGAAVVAISQDLDEIFELSDRICAIRGGRLCDPRPAAELTREAVGLMMSGGEMAA